MAQITGWANGKRRKFSTLVVNSTTYTYGTHFIAEQIKVTVNPQENSTVTLLGGDQVASLTKSSGMTVEADIVLNHATTDSSDILYNLTQSNGNRGNNECEVIEYADDGSTVVLRFTGDKTDQILMWVSDITSEAGSIKFKLHVHCKGCTVAQA